jgi:antitoxin component YwqK of YwqJK toxin-antitoxin module
VLEGTVDEYNPVGKLTFHGEYQNGVRHGPGTMYFPVSILNNGINAVKRSFS